MDVKIGDRIVIGGVELIAAPPKGKFNCSCESCYFYDEITDDCRNSSSTRCWNEDTFEDMIFKKVI